MSLLTGADELNKLTSLPICGFIAQLVDQRTGIAEVTGSNPVEALILSGFFFPWIIKSFYNPCSFQVLKLEINYDDHSSLSFTTAAFQIL